MEQAVISNFHSPGKRYIRRLCPQYFSIWKELMKIYGHWFICVISLTMRRWSKQTFTTNIGCEGAIKLINHKPTQPRVDALHMSSDLEHCRVQRCSYASSPRVIDFRKCTTRSHEWSGFISLVNHWCLRTHHPYICFSYDPISNVHKFSYDPISDVHKLSYDPISDVHTFSHDPISDVHKFSYDPISDVYTFSHDPIRDVHTFSYDPISDVHTFTS